MSTDFISQIRKHGLNPPAEIFPGKFYRFPGVDKDSHNTSGWAKLFENGDAGIFGDWSTDEKYTWFNKDKQPINPEARRKQKTEIKKARQDAEKKQRAIYKEAAKKAREIWNSTPAAENDHPYFDSKNVKSYGLHINNKNLLIPVYTENEEIMSIQQITPNGNKYFLKDSCTKSGFFPIGDIEKAEINIIVEGYATGATIYEATGLPVVIAFNANNLKSVSEIIRKKYTDKEILIAADDDYKTEGNPGVTKANEAAKAFNARVIIPDFGEDRPEGATDFNDIANNKGLEEVKRQIETSINNEVKSKDNKTNKILFSDFDNPEENKKNILKVKDNLILNTTNKKPLRIKRNIFYIADNDFLCTDLVKYDNATGNIIHSKNFRDIEDLYVIMRKYFSTYYNIELTAEDIKDLINYISNKHDCNSIVDVIKTYPRPENNPLLEIIKHITFKEIETPEIYFEAIDLFLKKMIIKLLSTDIKWLSYPNDIVLVLQGDQGIGKSLFCKWLAGFGFYVELGTVHGGDLTSKDVLLKIGGKIIAELGELSVMGRTGIEAVKAFISTAEDEYRPPYARTTKKVPRTISIIGTTNQDEYLIDATGNRRFFPLVILKIDFALFNKPELQKELLGFYYKWGIEYVTGSTEEIQTRLLRLNILSPALEIYLETARQDARVRSNYENQIVSYINTVKACNYERLGRTDSRTFFEYYNSGECAIFIFKFPGSIPRDFNKHFSATMREYGFINQNTRIAGKRIKHWIPIINNNGTVGTVEPLINKTISISNKDYIKDEVLKKNGSTVPTVPTEGLPLF